MNRLLEDNPRPTAIANAQGSLARRASRIVPPLPCLLGVITLCCGYSPHLAATVYSVTGHVGDYALAEGDPPTVLSATGTSLRVGANTNATPGGRNAVFLFELPVLPATEAVVSARLSVRVVSRAGAPAFNADLWALGFKNTSAPILTYFEGDAGDTNGLKLEDNLIGPNVGANTDLTTTNTAALGAYLANFYATNRGYAGGHFVFLRLNPDTDAGTTSLGWSVSSVEGGNPSVLQLTTARQYFLTCHTNDYAIAEGVPPTAVAVGGNSLRIGANSSTPAGGRNAVLLFELPPLQTNEVLLDATLRFSAVGRAGTPAFNVDLWGIGFAATPNPLLEYFEGDAGDGDHLKLEDNVFTPNTPGATNITISQSGRAALVVYLQSFYTTNAGYTGGQFVFFRLTPDADAGAGSVGWSVSTVEGGSPATLSLTIRQSDTRPNFLILITDDQRWDALGVVLREQASAARFPWFTNQTPNLDRLAAEGLRFRNAFVTYPLCSPSRAAILTGRYNHWNGILDNGTPFSATNLTFATQLRDAGYATAWIGKFHMDNQTTRPGFTYSASYVAHGQYNDATFLVNGASTATTGWVDDVATDYALNFLEANQAQPFALVVGFKTPHSPRTPPSRTATLYSNELARFTPNLDHLAPYRQTPALPAADDVRNYFRCLKAVDENVGRLLDRLDVLGLATNTFVLYCSDNGYYLGEHGLGDKRSMYEESLRIPLLVRYPPLIATPLARDEIVLNIDFAPTMLDLAGVPIPPLMQGRSWRPLLANQAVTNWRSAFFCQYFLESGYTTPTVLAARTLTAKLIHYPGHDAWTELFDLGADPYETNNVFGNPLYLANRQTLQADFQQLARETGLMPWFASPSRNGSVFQVRLTGGQGPRYALESSTNGFAWTPVQEIKMIPAETSLTLTNASNPMTLYRTRMIQDD